VSSAAAALAASLLVAGAPAQSVSPSPDKVSVTFYHEEDLNTASLVRPDDVYAMRSEGLAFVNETRTVDLPAGPALVEFRGVAATMVPQTAKIEGLPSGIVEQNFDYDLLSPGSLVAKSIGRTVHVIRTDPKTGRKSETTAVVRSAPSGVVLDEGDGKHEAFNCSGLPERLVFDEVPEGLADTPTLSVHTDAPAAGRYTLELSYVATGLTWSADYVARIRPGGKTLDLSGWITLANFGQTSFAQAPVSVIAGNLSRTGDDAPVDATALALSVECWPTNINWGKFLPPPPPPPPPPAPRAENIQDVALAVQTVVVTAEKRTTVEAQQLGDYKLYALPDRTDVHARETKQVQFLDQHDVPFEKLYGYFNIFDDDADISGDAALVVYRLQNKREAGLGKPLPAGYISFLEPGPEDQPIFVGNAPVGDTAVGLPVESFTGKAIDVIVAHHVASDISVGSGKDKRDRRSFQIAVENDKPIPIQFEIYQLLGDPGQKIVSESQAHTLYRGFITWRFALKAGERSELTFTVDTPEPD